MKNKFLIAIVAILVAVGALLGYKFVFGPDVQKGDKEVQIEISIPGENVDEKITVKTDTEFVYDLLMENQEKLGVSIEEQSFGPFLTGMKGYVATEAKKEFFSISINGEDAMVGIKEIPVKTGDVYRFELKNWE